MRIRLEMADSLVQSESDTTDAKTFILRTVWIDCPCGKTQPLFLTPGQPFRLPTGSNVWHYELSPDQKWITITPSIGLHQLAGHTPACHLQIANEEFEWIMTLGTTAS